MSILPLDGIREKLAVQHTKVAHFATPGAEVALIDGFCVVNQTDQVVAVTSDPEVAEAIKGIPTMYGAMRYALGLLDDGLASPEEVERACDALRKGMAKARGE